MLLGENEYPLRSSLLSASSSEEMLFSISSPVASNLLFDSLFIFSFIFLRILFFLFSVIQKLLLLFGIFSSSISVSKYISSIKTEFLEFFFFFLIFFFKDDNLKSNFLNLFGVILIIFIGRCFLLFSFNFTFILFIFCLMFISILFNLVEDKLLAKVFLISKQPSFSILVLSIYFCVCALMNWKDVFLESFNKECEFFLLEQNLFKLEFFLKVFFLLFLMFGFVIVILCLNSLTFEIFNLFLIKFCWSVFFLIIVLFISSIFIKILI